MKLLIGFTKLVLGIVLALSLLSLVGVAATRYFMARLTALPPRPTFANDAPPPAPPAPAAEAQSAQAAAPSPAQAVEPTDALPPGAYRAKVIQPIGLVLRNNPSSGAEQVGGVEYNQEVVVLEESEDQGWLRVRLTNQQEGWVKAGNTEKLN